MALALSGTSNGSLNNLSLTANTGTVVDTSDNPFLGYDSWYMNANQTANATITNWTRRPSSSGFTQVGSAMTVASGVFSFPTTGYWFINFKTYFDFNNIANDQGTISVQVGTSGTPDTTIESLFEGGGDVGDHVGTSSVSAFFDVTDTTNCVVQFVAGSIQSGNQFRGGSTSYTQTNVEFIKMGNT